MSWSSGEVINSQARLRRLSGAIPSSYTVFKIGSTYYAECNVPGGTEYSGADASTVIQAAINASPSGGKVVSIGDFTLSTGLTFLKTLSYEHYGTLKLSDPNMAMFTIGSVSINPTGGHIFVSGNCGGPDADTSTLVKQISGLYWDIHINSAVSTIEPLGQFGKIWEYAPESPPSGTTWISGNRMIINAGAYDNIWYIPTLPANVEVQGNKLDLAGTAHADQPILFKGGLLNSVTGFAHATGALGDIDDSESGGQNIFIVYFLMNPALIKLHPLSLLLYPPNSIIPARDESFSNLLPNSDFEKFSASGYPVGYGGYVDSVGRETTIVKRASSSCRIINANGDEARLEYSPPANIRKFLEGEYVTLTAWIYTNVNARVSIGIFDNDGSGYQSTLSGSTHTGSGTWERLTVTRKLRTGLTGLLFRPTLIGVGTPVTAYVDAVMLVMGNLKAKYSPSPLFDSYYNSGTATITDSTTVVFAHGLAGTPTKVNVGFKTTGYGSWIWSATSTQITITVTNSGTYTLSWDAEYKP